MTVPKVCRLSLLIPCVGQRRCVSVFPYWPSNLVADEVRHVADDAMVLAFDDIFTGSGCARKVQYRADIVRST